MLIDSIQSVSEDEMMVGEKERRDEIDKWK